MSWHRRHLVRIEAIAAAIVLTAAAAVLLTHARRHDTYKVTAVFEQAYGIVPGGQVWSGGGIVGSIHDIHIGPDGRPRVTMSIHDNYHLHATATADLRLASNSGELNRIITLTTGHGPPLAPGATIPATRTSAPVEVDDITAMLSPAVRADVRYAIGQFDAGTVGLDRAFRDTLEHSVEALNGGASVVEEVGSDGAALRTLLAQGRVATGALAARQARLVPAIDQVSRVLSTTAGRQAAVREAVRELPASLAAPRLALAQLRSSIPTLSRLLDAARPVVPQLRPTASLAASTLTAATPGLRDAARTFRTAPARLRELMPLLRVARPFATRLAPALRDALPVLDVVRVYTPEVMGLLDGWAQMSSTYDGAGHVLSLGINVVPPPNTTVPPGSNAPGYLARPFQRLPGALVGQPWTNYKNSFLSRPGGEGR